MKILLTANASWNLAHFRKPVIEALKAEGHDLVALAPEDEGVVALAGHEVPHRSIAIDSKGTSPLSDMLLIRAYRRALQEEAPDLVLSYTIKPNIYGGLAARTLALPFLPNVSGLGTAFLSGGALEAVAVRLYRQAFRPLPHVIFQNGDDRDLFVERGMVREAQAVLVPGSGIDLDHYAPVPLPASGGGQVTFLLIARLLRDKGVVEFVEAARAVRQQHPEVRFQLLGEVGAENRTAISAETVAAWVEEGVVEYLGKTGDVRPFIAAADCVVLPSYREGMPRTLLEAAAMGRPVVATDVPGCRDVAQDGVTGLLCRARDADGLARALLRMIEIGPEGRSVFGGAGRSLMEKRFSQAIVVDIYRDLINRMTQTRHA
ncbi:glycosyltransferase family 4 protein [Ovoidimarina sediminis]|uniref:glycosyltransferase family 4 protein n=1 Tax=Ovoidimarina sediminis TaxID=3079856 RepID=UPI002908B64E|nr:glycosyltransferase family 4 protein [Rhodophyticola sp. MJ-SS7]MDU8944952.1 glycosyltransferase family 4 protein [Rhodophyticola sp. MJ-SS7]